MASFYTEDELFRLKGKPEDENDWPAFTLNNVTVVAGDDGQVANLLEATPQRPVTITGQLEPPDLKLRKLLLAKPPAQPWPLSIDCTHYSYGIYDNGDIDIWAAGDAGWFLIDPDSSFKKTYDDMIAAVRLFYHMADAYKEDKKTSVEKILRISHKAMQMPRRNLQDLFTRYVRFFGIQVAKGAEIGSWSRTTLYQYMKEQHPEALPSSANSSKKRAISKPKHEPEAEPSRAGLRSRAAIAVAKHQSITVANAPKKLAKIGRAARYENDSKDKVKTPESDAGEQRATAILEAEPLWKGIQRAVKLSDFDREEATLAAVSNELLSIFDLEDELQAVDFIRLHAPGLVAIITGLTHRKDSWQRSKFWVELNAAKLSRSTAAKLRQLQIQPHDDANLDDSTNDSDDSEESDPKTPVRGKGTLRLVSGKKSAKRYTGKSKGKMRVIEVDEDEDADMEAEDDELGHTGEKRKAPRDNPPVRKSKRLAGPFIQSESDDEEEAEEEDEELSAMDGAADNKHATSVDAIPFKKDLLLGTNIDLERDVSGNGPAPSFLSLSDQIMDPDDASDVWHCKHDGCMETVYGASKDKTQGIIREHLDSHDNMIKAVLGEQAMTHKPVGNLLRLLREKAGGYPEALAMLEGNPMGFAAPVATMM